MYLPPPTIVHAKYIDWIKEFIESYIISEKRYLNYNVARVAIAEEALK